MNELQRQAYLSSLGIENYMPRWQLVAAPAATQAFIPLAETTIVAPQPVTENLLEPIGQPKVPLESAALATLNALTEVKADKAKDMICAPVSAASILKQLEVKPVERLQPFSLSVWRPAPGFLLIDSRDASLALPTELLLHNILAVLFGLDIKGQEEVLRWPAVENRFVSRTPDAACSELQTWLAVEHELRPITQLWLMGENAAHYLLSNDTSVSANLWRQTPVAVGSLKALLLPSLNELLQNPQLKSRLWASVKP